MYDTQGQPLDLSEWLDYFAFDSTSAVVLGTPFGFMEKHGDINGTISQLKQGFRYAAIIGQVPELHPWLLGNRTLMGFLKKYTSFPDPTVEVLQVCSTTPRNLDQSTKHLGGHGKTSRLERRATCPPKQHFRLAADGTENYK